MKKELFLKTAFSCMACDGEIANEEINLVKSLAEKTTLFEGIDVENVLNSFIQEINKKGKLFLVDYLADIKSAEFAKEEKLALLDLAFKTINSDNIIEYSEFKFLKYIQKWRILFSQIYKSLRNQNGTTLHSQISVLVQ